MSINGIKKNKALNVKVTEKVYNEFSDIAREKDYTVSDLLRVIVREYIEQNRK
jgi:antitoxin component of RelBE/YafQ-DinJ toxin-antitoxin module